VRLVLSLTFIGLTGLIVALDSEAEHVVQGALNRIMTDMTQTTIVIAHRLSTVRNADRIAVIDKGKVREIGTHDDLMAIPGGTYRHLHDLQNLDFVVETGEKHNAKQERKEDEREGELREVLPDGEEPHLTKEDEKKYSERARLMAKGDGYYFAIGSLGAVLAGLMFPAWGFIFAYMVQALYYRVDSCSDTLVPPIAWYPEFETCQEYWDDAAEFMKDLSMKVFYGLLGIMASSLIGNILMFYGFGTATERMNKRVRDAAFGNLIRQEVSYFDVRSVGTITTQLSDDAALIHTFSGQPIRMLVMSLSSVLVGVIVAFVYMWPFALLSFGLMPFMSVGKALQVKAYIGDEIPMADPDALPPNSSGGILVESLLNIRTVASLTIEVERVEEFQAALDREDPNPARQNVIRGSTVGLAFLVQFWSIGLMFWFGGWLLFRFPEDYEFRDMMISMFGLMFGLSGIGLAMADLADSEKAKAAARRIFDLMDRESRIDPLSESGKKLN